MDQSMSMVGCLLKNHSPSCGIQDVNVYPRLEPSASGAAVLGYKDLLSSRRAPVLLTAWRSIISANKPTGGDVQEAAPHM
jgi:hypothetical protein